MDRVPIAEALPPLGFLPPLPHRLEDEQTVASGGRVGGEGPLRGGCPAQCKASSAPRQPGALGGFALCTLGSSLPLPSVLPVLRSEGLMGAKGL